MKLDVIKLDGGKGGSIELADDIFGIEEIRGDILQRVVTWQLAKRRSGNHKIQVRNEVSRTSKKMYKHCLLYTSPSPRDRTRSRMPSSA